MWLWSCAHLEDNMIQSRIVLNRIKMLSVALLTVSAIMTASVSMAIVSPLAVYAAENVKDEDATGTVTGKSLNVRSGPGKDNASIGKLNQGDTVKITGVCDNGWYRIDLDGKEGYVSDQYVEKSAAATDSSEESETDKDTEEGEPEEGYSWRHPSPTAFRALLIVPALLLVIAAIFFTLKKMRDDDDEDDEDYDDFSDDEDEDEDEEYDDEDEDDEDDEDDITEDGEDADSYEDPRLEKKIRRESSKQYIIREEDYQVHIDPSFFEDVDPIEQPAMVTGYLDRLQAEKDALSKEIAEPSEKLDKEEKINQAMEKLMELQKEIERLKSE